MLVNEILSEVTGPGTGPFTVVQQGTGRNKIFNILGPNGSVVGSEKLPGTARSTASRLNAGFRERVFVLPPEGQPMSPELRRWIENGGQGEPPRSARPTSTSSAGTPRATSNAPQGFKSLVVNADGSLSGELADGTKFDNDSFDDLAKKKPGLKATVDRVKPGIFRRMIGKAVKTGFWGGLTAILGGLQVAIVWEEAGDEIAKVYAEMHALRLRDEHRQRYYNAAMGRINKKKWVNTITIALASLASGIAGAATASRVRTLVQGFAMIARFGGPIGWVAGLLVVALSEGLIYLLGWAINNYGEDMANFLADKTMETLIDAGKAAGETVVDTVTGVMDSRGPNVDIDTAGAQDAMRRDENDPDSGNPSSDAKRAINWLD